MSIKMVIVNGSPRKKGNTAALVEQVTAGAVAAGAQVESYYLHGMEIAPCDGCDACRTEAYAGCIVDDDMQEIYPHLEEADALVIASPVYWFTVSAQTKLLMDRCYAMKDEGGYMLRGKKIGVVMVYGDSDPFNSGAVNAFRTFQDAYAYVGAEMVGIVHGSAGDPGEIRKDERVMGEAYELGRRLGAGG
jgi:multimeric flavodoxin WrbA